MLFGVRSGFVMGVGGCAGSRGSRGTDTILFLIFKIFGVGLGRKRNFGKKAKLQELVESEFRKL